MLAQGQLLNTTSPIYICPLDTVSKIKTVIFFNGDSVTNVVSLYLVQNSSSEIGTATASNQILNVSLISGDTFEFSPSFPIEFTEHNDSIQAKASNSDKVNFFVLGIEI